MDALGDAATNADLSHREAQEVIGSYLEVTSSPLSLEISVTKSMERLAETVEANLMSVKYSPSRTDGLSGKRARVLEELEAAGRKINFTTRLLVVRGGTHVALTPEQLWDQVLEGGQVIDLRVGLKNGLDPILASKLRGLM
jgi:hypothetical protein